MEKSSDSIVSRQHGIGNNDLTSVSVVASTIHLAGTKTDKVIQFSVERLPKRNMAEWAEHLPQRERESHNSLPIPFKVPDGIGSDEVELREYKLEQTKVSKFYESIKSRMLVAEVIERIRAGGKGRTHNYQSKK